MQKPYIDMTLSDLWGQLKIFKEILKRFGKNTIFFLVLILSIPVIFSYYNYGDKQGVAFLIYSELTFNIRALDNIIYKNDKGEYFYHLGNKFIQKDYEKFYKYFGKLEIDIPLKNFYFNLNNNSRMYRKNDLLDIKSQGEQAAKLLSDYFGCRDWYETKKYIEESNIASGQTVASTFNPIGYWKFVNKGRKVYIFLVFVLLPISWFVLYKKIYSFFFAKKSK